MSSDMGDVTGTRKNPWLLSTPGGASRFSAYRDPMSVPPGIVVKAGETVLRFHLRCLNDLDEMLKSRGDWMLLGSVEENQPAAPGTVEEWARSPHNPVQGWYGLTKGARGRFADYIPPIMAALDLAELDESPEGMRIRTR